MRQVYLQLKVISMDVNVPRLASFAADMCKSLEISEKKSMYLCFVLETVLEMRMKQLGADNPYIEIEVAKDRETIYISVKDLGLPYILTDNQRRLIATGLVDGYKLEQLGSEGQRIVFWLRQDEYTELAMPEIEEEKLLDDTISIYLTQPNDEDANEVLRCFYSAYGYNYLHQELYRLSELKSMLRGGHYVSILAKNEHGQVPGHVGLREDEEALPGLLELCNLVTKPYARGKGVAKMLFKAAVDAMNETENAEGLFVEGAAFHLATAKLCNYANCTPCGFYLEFLPSVSVDPRFRKGDARMSCFYAVSIRDKERLHTLYVADEIRAFTDKIFSREKLNYTFASPERLPERCHTDVSVDAFLRIVRIVSDECNADLANQVTDILGGSETKGMELAVVCLNANQSGAVRGYTDLRRMGFIFAGWLPGSRRGDYIFLEKFLKQPFDRRTMTLEPNYDELLDELMEINGGRNGILE